MVLIVIPTLIGMFVSVAIATEKYVGKQTDQNAVTNKIAFVFRKGRDVVKAKSFFKRQNRGGHEDLVEMVFQEMVSEDKSMVNLHLAQKIDKRIT